MKIVFYHSDKPRERVLAEAFADGIRKGAGEQVVLRTLDPDKLVAEDCDVACMVGVKSKELFWNHWNQGIRTIYFDKGYSRHSLEGPIKSWEYWRVSVNAHHPTETFKGIAPDDARAEMLGFTFEPWRKQGGHIVIAGSSAKYHAFYGLSEPTKYARKLIETISKHSDRTIVYRPKPSWKDAVPVDGSVYSSRLQDISDVLKGAHALVTHGSNACFEAVTFGVPCIVLGNAVAKTISSQTIQEIETPKLVSDEERRKWFSDLAYCQWTLPEMATGEAWKYIKPQLYRC